MTTATGQDAAQPQAVGKAGRWIADWRPEDAGFWKRGGARVARRNLAFSVLSEHVGFSVWSLWSVFVLFLTPSYGISHDLKTAAAEKFVLTTLPTALGAGVRLPYTFAVAKFGGRNWTVVSASLLLVPTVAAAVALRPGVSYGTLLVLAALAGVGGGNFASSMANINSFYPQRLMGWALGLNAGGGNLGVAVVQLAGLAVLATAGKGHPRVLLGIYIPLVVLAALGAALFMDNLAHVRNEKRALRDASRDPQTWVIALVRRDVRLVHRLRIRLRAGAGRPIRRALPDSGQGGPGQDRLPDVPGPAARLAEPAARRPAGRPGRRCADHLLEFRADGPGGIGRAGVLVNIAFRQSFLASGTGDAAYIGFIAFYLLCLCLTWLCYLRPARQGLAGA